jgi:hypothetical protein
MCYLCLLHSEEGPGEAELYHEMQHICVKRRLLYYLLEYGPTAHIKRLHQDFSKHLNVLLLIYSASANLFKVVR